jgi:hypothetical protein
MKLSLPPGSRKKPDNPRPLASTFHLLARPQECRILAVAKILRDLRYDLRVLSHASIAWVDKEQALVEIAARKPLDFPRHARSVVDANHDEIRTCSEICHRFLPALAGEIAAGRAIGRTFVSRTAQSNYWTCRVRAPADFQETARQRDLGARLKGPDRRETRAGRASAGIDLLQGLKRKAQQAPKQALSEPAHGKASRRPAKGKKKKSSTRATFCARQLT